jgi:hypothetical protein
VADAQGLKPEQGSDALPRDPGHRRIGANEQDDSIRAGWQPISQPRFSFPVKAKVALPLGC